MAEKKRKRRSSRLPIEEMHEERKNDFERLLDHARENPLLYTAAGIFIVFCILAGIFFRLEKMHADVNETTAYVEALDTENAALRVAALEKVAADNSRWSAEALYMAGEAAIEAMDYDKAKACFEKVCDQYADSDYVPNALDGLAFLAENAGDLEAALAGYRKVYTEFPTSFIAQREPLNIGRVLEKQEKWAEAKASYEEQGEVFPDSRAAARAEQALTKLRRNHPDLFPDEEEPSAQTEEANGEGTAPAEKTGEDTP